MNAKARTVKADADTATAPLELWTQTQANEGSETNAPKASPTNTTDVDAALDVPVNKANSGTSAAGGAAERLLGAGADWVSGKINGGGTTATAKTTATTGTNDAKDAGAACPNGDCGTGQCTDGNCANCKNCTVK